MTSPTTPPPSPLTSPYQIRRAAVLGAGIMGRKIAARLASVGVSVVLLDLTGRKINNG